MCLYERLRRISVCLREEENACQVLAAVAVHALCRSFDMAVENKQGISNLELLYEEISREERSKELKKEQKKLKKRKKRNEKKLTDNVSDITVECGAVIVSENCSCLPDDIEEDDRDDRIILCDGTIIDAASKPFIVLNKSETSVTKTDVITNGCISCQGSATTNFSPSNVCTRASIDGGYSSEPLHTESSHMSSNIDSTTSSLVSTPEGSEVACSEGFCNHGGLTHSKTKSSLMESNNGVGILKSTSFKQHYFPGLPMTLQEMLVRFITNNLS